MEKEVKKSDSAKTTVRVGKFAIIGIVLSVFNFLIYTLLARLFFKDNAWLWLDSAMSYALSAILAYILHSEITWKERSVTKRSIAMFFLWNGITAFIIGPFFTWLFGLIKPLYGFAFNISSAIRLPFDYAFVESTGVFLLVAVITMTLNYLFYDRLVFGGEKPTGS